MAETHTLDNELITVPNSMKEKIEQAQRLLDQSERAETRGDHSLAVVKAREGMRVLRELSRTSPNHAALIMAAEMGHRGFEFETVERLDVYKVVERKFMGIVVGTDIVNQPIIKRRVHRGRIY